MKKKLILKLANLISIFWKIIPEKIREQIITGILILESRGRDTKFGLKRLFLIKDKLNLVINERAMILGDGTHPKHRLTNYHDFFIKRIKNGQNVLDIGCGYGAVAKSIAMAKPKSLVIGVDIDEKKLEQANMSQNMRNLKFKKFDATKNVPKGKWEVIILSNVLEHIKERVMFLKQITTTTKAKCLLIRVPHFERDWEIPLRQELKVNYFSDSDHKIEHRLEELILELKSARIRTKEILTIWGEIWAECEVKVD